MQCRGKNIKIKKICNNILPFLRRMTEETAEVYDEEQQQLVANDED